MWEIAPSVVSLSLYPDLQFLVKLGGTFFATLAEQQLRRGTHRSVPALEKAIREFLQIYNDDPKSFRWAKSADEIIESVNRVLKRIK